MLKQRIASFLIGLMGHQAPLDAPYPPLAAPTPKTTATEVGVGKQSEAAGTRAWLEARPAIKAQVDRHIKAGTAYTQITAWMREQGYPHSYRAFWAYASAQGARRYAPRRKTGAAA